MTRTTRYILKQLATTTLFIAAALTGVVWLSQSLRFLDFIINKGLSFVSFLKLTMLLLPSLLAVILPVAALCAILFVYNRLSTDRELVVMRAAGLSQRALVAPAVLLAVAVTLCGYALNLYLMPAGYRAFKDEQYVLRADYSQILLQEGVFNDVLDGLTVYVRTREPGGEVRGILVHDERQKGTEVTMMAERGALVNSPEGPRLVLVTGNRQEKTDDAAEDEASIRMLYFDRYTIDLTPLTEQPASRYREPRERFLHELLRPPQTPSEEQHQDELIAEAHVRLVTPFYAVTLALIATAAMLSGEFSRRSQWKRIIAAVAAAAGFEAVAFSLGSAIVKRPEMVPVFYLWPLLVGLAAIVVTGQRRLPRWLARQRGAAQQGT